MREIKFRAWDKKDKYMLLPSDIEWCHNLTFEGKINHSGGVVHGDKSTMTNETVEIMQFTGLKDKNVKEIYEGDILKYSYEEVVRSGLSMDRITLKREVKFSGGCFYVTDKTEWVSKCLSEIEKKNREVIGNIYQNKDLLKGGK